MATLGSSPQVGCLDYPIHDLVLLMQGSVLRDLLSGDRLSRLKDIELKTAHLLETGDRIEKVLNAPLQGN